MGDQTLLHQYAQWVWSVVVWWRVLFYNHLSTSFGSFRTQNIPLEKGLLHTIKGVWCTDIVDNCRHTSTQHRILWLIGFGFAINGRNVPVWSRFFPFFFSLQSFDYIFLIYWLHWEPIHWKTNNKNVKNVNLLIWLQMYKTELLKTR